jgi:hypothetical protein
VSDSTNPGTSDAADRPSPEVTPPPAAVEYDAAAPDPHPDAEVDVSPDAATEAYPGIAADGSETAAYPPPTPPAYGAPAAPAEYGTPPAYGAAPPAYGATTPPAFGATPPAYGSAPAYGAAPSYSPAPTYGSAPAYSGGGYGAQPKTNTLAIVSLIAGIVGLVLIPLLGSLTAVITGHMSLSQIKRTGEGGRGLGLTGTILGWVGLALGVIGVIIFIAFWGWFLANVDQFPVDQVPTS